MRKSRTFARTFLAGAIAAVGSMMVTAAPAQADTMVGACNVVSTPSLVSHTECIGAAPTGGDFTGLDLSFADFTGSNLAGTNFTGANLTNADFTGASATGTNFTNSTLTNADFTGSTIAGAGFSGASVIPDDATITSPDGNPTAFTLPGVGNGLTRDCSPPGPYAVGSTIISCTVSTTGTITTSATATFTITVVVAPTLTGPAAAEFTVGTAGNYVLSTLTGTPAPTVGAVGLPTGLMVDPASGAITGTPIAGSGGVYSVTLTASNGVTPDASLAISLTVNEALGISGDPTATFTAGDPGGSYAPTITGFPAATFSALGLPSGLSIDPITGEITGTPLNGSDGTYPIVITATNGGEPVTLNVIVTVAPAVVPPGEPATPSDESDDASLPDTGGVHPGLLPLGVLLIAAGALTLGNRRRLHRPAHRA